MSKWLARFIVPPLLCLIQFQPAMSQQRESKQKKQEGQSEIRKEIDALKETQQQILNELQEIKRLLLITREIPEQKVASINVHGEPYRGNSGASVAIVEYSDFQCPYCARYVQEIYPKIEQDYIKTGKIRYLFRDFPLPIHPQAMQAAEAARCAGEQGKFWEMHDRLFSNQSALSIDDLPKHAQALGLEPAKFNECMASGKYARAIRGIMSGAERMGVNGTPAFLIGTVSSNGDVISSSNLILGVETYETFKSVLDELLSPQKR